MLSDSDKEDVSKFTIKCSDSDKSDVSQLRASDDEDVSLLSVVSLMMRMSHG